jgi:hypothetical protein
MQIRKFFKRAITDRAGVAALLSLILLAFWFAIKSRLPYLNQIPVFDADVTTSTAMMWAHIWWTEGPLNVWLSMPYSPPSVETASPGSIRLYQSWPPGFLLPVYLTALLTGSEPSIAQVNWINAGTNGAVAIAVATTGYTLARINHLNPISAVVLGLCAGITTIAPWGLAYVFSQVYCVTTHILVYIAVFLLLESLSLLTTTTRSRQTLFTAQLLTIYFAFFVDWLAYTVFAAWIFSRWLGGRLGYIGEMSLGKMIVLLSLPVSAFGIFLFWRLESPGSIAQSNGFYFSLHELVWKLFYRMNLTESHPISNFFATFAEMHSRYWFEGVGTLLGLALATSAFCILILHRIETDSTARYETWSLAHIGFLATFPLYGHMLLLYQHTAIHPWAIAKIMFSLAIIPFVVLPIVALRITQVFLKRFSLTASKPWLAAAGSLAVLFVTVCANIAFVRASDRPYLMGRVQPDYFEMWNDIRKNTTYSDIVFSPTLNAPPIGVAVGVSHKLVYPANSFDEIEARIATVCDTFNIVIALPTGTQDGAFAALHPSSIHQTPRIRLMRFDRYAGPRNGC